MALSRLTGDVTPGYDPRITGLDPQSRIFITGEGATGNPINPQNVANINLDGAGQSNPNIFQQLVNNAMLMGSNIFGVGSVQASQNPRVTGDVTPATNPRITGDISTASNVRVTGSGTGSNSGGGGGGSSIPQMGVAPGGGGGGGKPPVTGGVSPIPAPGGGGGFNINPALQSNLGRAARYAPGAAVAVNALNQGDVAGSLGAAGATAIAGKFMQNAARGIPNPIARGAVLALGSLAAGGAGQFAGNLIGKGASALAGGAQNVAGGISNVQREGGNVPFGGQSTGLGALTNLDLQRQQEIANLNINNSYRAAQLNQQLSEKARDNDQVRQMQLNNQLGRLTTGMQQQIIAGQLTGQLVSEQGANLRTMITAPNPYAASVLQTGGLRGIG